MRSVRTARRSFLRAMGTGFAILPFARLLENSVAQAAGATIPLKFVTIYHPHGIAAEYWALRAGETETSFDLSSPGPDGVTPYSLKPFDDAATYGKSFKDKVLVVEGVDLLSSANGHDTAGTILTGSKIDSSKPQNSSLDQYLAVEQKLGADTRITSVNLAVGRDQTDVGLTLSYSTGGVALPKIIDPVQAYHLLFDGFTVNTTDPVAQAAADRQRAMDQAVVDYVKGDVNRLRAKLGPAEQVKLDSHLNSLHEIEKGLAAPVMNMTTQKCMVPSIPDASQFPSLRQYNGGEPYFDAITNAHIDILAQALACDITRFATLFMNDLSYTGNPLMLPADNHGSVAHTYNASSIGMNNQPGSGDSKTWVPLAKFNGYAYSKVARLMKALDDLGALDSTIIYVSSDMGNPALHSTRNVPTVIAGGANGLFKMGRRIKLPDDCPMSDVWCEGKTTYTPTANSKILVSIAQAFGVQTNTFGTQPDPANVTGPLSALTG